MGIADIIVLALLGIAVFAVLRYRWNAAKNHTGCCGCGDGTACKKCKEKE